MTLIDVVLDTIGKADTAYEVGLGFDGCPCFRLYVGGIVLDGYCWRTGPPEIKGCSLEYGGDDAYRGDSSVVTPQQLAEALKPKLDKMDWYGEWTVVLSKEWGRK